MHKKWRKEGRRKKGICTNESKKVFLPPLLSQVKWEKLPVKAEVIA